jgi:aryl-alcohol dehydrogenase-like predicted oxidoreductase
MRTVSLGKSGAGVSALCLGTMHFGSLIDWKSSCRLLDLYVEAGGGFIDTANNYAVWAPGYQGGESEALLGQWMQERKNRSRIFLASKVGFHHGSAERGLRARQILGECDKSLQRLRTDTIDLYYAHLDDRQTPLPETLEAFDRLVQAGKVRWLGASNTLAWRLEEARCTSARHGWPEYCCIQQRYSYLQPRPGADFGHQTAATEELLDYCQERGLRLLAYSPLLNGAYTRRDRPLMAQYQGPHTSAALRVLQAVAAEVGATLNQVVLAWMLHSEPQVIPVMGASTEEQLRENLGALDVRLDAGQMARLDSRAMGEID